MDKITMNHLRELESESIHVIREVAAQFERPALLFSGGKDSIVMFHLARKSFLSCQSTFPIASH
jgi:sulfate adenylyltransferase subunit 2